MMFFRFIAVSFSLIIGYFASTSSLNVANAGILGIVAGGFVAIILILIEQTVKTSDTDTVLGVIIALVSSVVLYHLIISGMDKIHLLHDSSLYVYVKLFLLVLFIYTGVIIGVKKKEFLGLIHLKALKTSSVKKDIKIFDTSVIIDGRIKDICETGFVEGDLLVPKFVLKELQLIADSSDSLKRNRGRRGLDILQSMQKSTDIDIKIVDDDFPKIKDVDTKLVALGQKLRGKVVTNDFNLNKVAELQGVAVLNINQLANSVKPVVLPGELMNVHILREGKELGQGIGYLEDGTMIVVEGAKKKIGVDMDVLVTSVLQTTAGRMIFAKLKGDELREVNG